MPTNRSKDPRPCVLSRSPMAATAVLRAATAIPISAPSKPARKHKLSLARKLAKTSPFFFLAIMYPLATSASLLDASSPPSPKARSNPKLPQLLPTLAKPSSKPSSWHKMSTSAPSAPIPGSTPSATISSSPATANALPTSQPLSPLRPPKMQSNPPTLNRLPQKPDPNRSPTSPKFILTLTSLE